MTKATRWRKSTRSTSQNACVELDVSLTGTQIRDSKNPSGRVLSINADSWSTFMADVVLDIRTK